MFAETIQGIVREEEKRESIEKEKREKDDQGVADMDADNDDDGDDDNDDDDDDGSSPPSSTPSPSPPISGFVIGDKVELSEDYLLKGDAGSGPLKQFDRGTVIEIQVRMDESNTLDIRANETQNFPLAADWASGGHPN